MRCLEGYQAEWVRSEGSEDQGPQPLLLGALRQNVESKPQTMLTMRPSQFFPKVVAFCLGPSLSLRRTCECWRLLELPGLCRKQAPPPSVAKPGFAQALFHWACRAVRI